MATSRAVRGRIRDRLVGVLLCRVKPTGSSLTDSVVLAASWMHTGDAVVVTATLTEYGPDEQILLEPPT